ncbi:hypothetical protein [Actinokineospora globicatena]|uniref:hypothetical protein n=1 Tax=Actinokineospora globicatena TaxID=103729 RepID=UPI0020A43A71|nr:hypothetical protein [Actinokineospora globicatena]MCP2306061.1 hypothetical protein [Actinokineospora globicatena]GLW80066.1 hypothetical protein Aglo01_45470 [Actinokineospora globicatena]GLW86895.1 hypothetical protein Aglo02_45340 [Actinokineospora globicatena]
MGYLTRVLTITAMVTTAAIGGTGTAAAEDDPQSGVVTNVRPADDGAAACGREGWVRNDRALGVLEGGSDCVARADVPTFRYTTAGGTYVVGAIPDRLCVTTRDGVTATSAVNDTARVALLYPNTACRGLASVVFPKGTYQGAAFRSMLFLTVSG